MNQPKINVNMRDNFDANLFNKIYEDNKISDVYDEGYGDWMNKGPTSENQQKLFQNGFNKDMFNSTFEQYKKEHQEKNKHQLVKYGEPETRISMKNQDHWLH